MHPTRKKKKFEERLLWRKSEPKKVLRLRSFEPLSCNRQGSRLHRRKTKNGRKKAKIEAEINAEKVEILSPELVQLKSLLDLKHETEADENNEMMLNLKVEIESLKRELEEAKKFERSVSESLESVMKQLENNNDSLHDAESEIASLKEKVGLLEMTIGGQIGDLEESERRISKAKDETTEAMKLVESLKSELETIKEEKMQAIDNEKLAASSVQALLEEKNKLINELENFRDEEENSKKAMKSLASALHEVSTEAREAKEKLLSSGAEHEHYETQLEDLRLVLKATNENYETMLDDAKNEIDLLTNTLARFYFYPYLVFFNFDSVSYV